MKFLQSRIAQWFSRGLNNGPNLMHSCESTSLSLFTMSTHRNVCTDHCCENSFLSHVQLWCSLMRQHPWRAILADPDTPRWPIPQAGPSHQLRISTRAGGVHWEGRDKPVLLAAPAGCCHSCSERFQLCNLLWFGVNLCSFSKCQDMVALSLSPWASSGVALQLLKQTPPGYKQIILTQL